MQSSPLMDAPRFARGVEAAYRQMWRCLGGRCGKLVFAKQPLQERAHAVDDFAAGGGAVLGMGSVRLTRQRLVGFAGFCKLAAAVPNFGAFVPTSCSAHRALGADLRGLCTAESGSAPPLTAAWPIALFVAATCSTASGIRPRQAGCAMPTSRQPAAAAPTTSRWKIRIVASLRRLRASPDSILRRVNGLRHY